MNRCPSQDWDDHAQHLEEQAEAEIAFYQKHADKIAAVAAGLASAHVPRSDVPSGWKPQDVLDLVAKAAIIVAEIVKRGEPVDGPDFGPNIEAEEMMRKTYEKKIAELEKELETVARSRDITNENAKELSRRLEATEKERDYFAEKLRTMTGYRDAIRDQSEAKIKQLEKELGEEGGKVIRLERELAESEEKREAAVCQHVEQFERLRANRDELVEGVRTLRRQNDELRAKVATPEKLLAESVAEGAQHWLQLCAFKSGRLGRVGLFGKTVAFTVSGRKDEPFTVATFEVEGDDLDGAYARAVELAFGRTPASEEGGET